MSRKLLTPKQAAKELNITTRTLAQWQMDGKIPCTRTKGGHRRYLLEDLIPQRTREKVKVCYARVSSYAQKEDLERQVTLFKTKYSGYRIIKDIGSGLSFKRRGIKTILELAIKGELEELVVTHRDRLCRFGFELFEWLIFTFSSGKLLVLDSEEGNFCSPEEELVKDLLAITTSFSGRLHGLRSHQIKRKIKEATKDSEGKTVSK